MTSKQPAQPLISAVICTYNRADLLGQALKSLCQQSLSPNAYEMIVVNNASTDHTEQVVRAIQAQHPYHIIQLVVEPRPGLGYARNTAWKHAQSKIVAYIDDDALAVTDWLDQIVLCFQTVKPTPLCVGGPVDVLYNVPKPHWFKDAYEIMTWGSENRFLREGEVFAGGNMAWAKAALATYGGFDVDKGVKGDKLSLGEETWLFHRIWDQESSPAFYYSTDVRIQHLVAPQKLRLRYRIKRAFVAGQIDAREHIRERTMTRRNRLGTASVKLGRALRKAVWATGQFRRYAHWQNWVYEAIAPAFVDVGNSLGMLGLYPTVKHR